MPSLALHAKPSSFARTRNAMPVGGGAMRTRPAAYQVYAPSVLSAVAWGKDRWLVDSGGRWLVVTTTGGVVADLAASAPGLSATAYQALTGGGVRTDRVYFGSSDETLRYVEDTGAGYTLTTVVNDILDPSMVPYPLNPARAVCTWRQRIWTLEETNRIQHSLNNLPHSFDPLHTLEFQTGRKDHVRAFAPAGEGLAVGCLSSLWLLSGDSPYNWARSEVAVGRGAVGRNAIVSDGASIWHCDEKGVYQAGRDLPLSDDIEEIFETPDYDAALALAPDNEYLYLLAHGRVFCLLLSSGEWGELDLPGTIYGFWSTSDELGVYGSFGVWRISDDFLTSDFYLDGHEDGIPTELETWDEVDPLSDRQLLRRVALRTRADADSTATYTAYVDGAAAYSETFSTSDGVIGPTTGAGVSADLLAAAPAPRELSPMVAGGAIRHKLASDEWLELVSFAPVVTARAEARLAGGG